ncbi:MAG: hypothetical protein JWO82_1915 [Akkermansiaceae bacterium]|nr:hypothetical protein [Akkermansiaceae bacterium]
MKRALLCWFAACLPGMAGLKFDSTRKEIDAPPDATVIKARFSFVNDGQEPVTITRADAGCSCVVVALEGDKKTYAPGEKGTVQADFDMSNFSGIAEKQVGVWVKGDSEDKPSALLNIQVKIPVLIQAEPKTLFWDIGSKPEPKTVTLTMNYTDPIHILEVSGANPNYTQVLKTIEDGRKYELTITPKTTAQVDIAVFHIDTDCKIQKHRSQRVFTSVRKPVPAEAAKP